MNCDRQTYSIEHLEHQSVDFGPIVLTFYWENRFAEVGRALGKWLGLKLGKETKVEYVKRKKPNLKFVIGTSLSGDMSISRISQIVLQTWAWDARIVYAGTEEILYICNPRINFKKKVLSALPQGIVRFANPLFHSYWELQAGYLLYHIILRAMHTVLLERQVVFVHAASLSDPLDNAILIAGAGGIGKTTTSAHLMSTGFWRLIADDFVLVSKEGKVWDSRLPAHIYSYHSHLLNLMDISEIIFANWLDKLHWKIYSILNKKGSVRRVSLPEKSHQGKIKACFVVDVAAGTHGETVVEDISPKEAAHSVAHYTLAELNLEEPQSYLEDTTAVLSKALDRAICYRVVISERARGSGLANAILKIVKEGLE